MVGHFLIYFFIIFSEKNPVCRDRTHVPTCQVTRLPLSYRGDLESRSICIYSTRYNSNSGRRIGVGGDEEDDQAGIFNIIRKKSPNTGVHLKVDEAVGGCTTGK